MKALLASLLCFVLTMSQAFAIKGGPSYPAGKSIQGAYAGVLESAFDPTDPFSSNSIGIFTLVVPSVGQSTGVFVSFVRGSTFNGTIQGIANPNKGTISGILNAQFTITSNNFTIVDPFFGNFTSNTASVQATAAGSLKATVSSPSTVFSSISSTLITGTAVLFITQTAAAAGATPTPAGGGGTGSLTTSLSFTVSGFKQGNGIGAATSG